jgi:hypothetical protein
VRHNDTTRCHGRILAGVDQRRQPTTRRRRERGRRSGRHPVHGEEQDLRVDGERPAYAGRRDGATRPAAGGVRPVRPYPARYPA